MLSESVSPYFLAFTANSIFSISLSLTFSEVYNAMYLRTQETINMNEDVNIFIKLPFPNHESNLDHHHYDHRTRELVKVDILFKFSNCRDIHKVEENKNVNQQQHLDQGYLRI